MRENISKEEAELIFREHSHYIYKTALFLTKSKELADDVTQETFIRVFRKYNTFDPSKPIKPWLYKITLNITRNALRKKIWFSFTNKLPDKMSLDLVENSILKSEEEKELWKQINSLSLKSKEVIVLHFYSGLKLNEISDTLGIPLGTCKSRINSALNALRKQIPENEFCFLDKGGDLYETI